ncbi:MAG TPA: two component system sensor kinase [Arsenophonus nasoniae]|uniref:two component system sensor kinase n=1 Tax=Arsenophonus nasoniae TaxID=638 RepID=UPI0038793FE1
MNTHWCSSLVTKLTFAFISVLISLWILIEVNSYNNIYSGAIQHILMTYHQTSEIRAHLNRNLFKQAITDIQQLEHRISESQFECLHFPDQHELVARQINIGSHPMETNMTNLWALQTFGTSGQQRYIDTFIIEPGKSIAIYALSTIERNNLTKRITEITALAKQPTTDGFRWSEPFYDAVSKRSYVLMSYTQPSQKSNHQQVGFVIDINDMLDVSNIYHASDINFFLTPKGVLSFNNELNISQKEMSDIKMLMPTYTHLLGSLYGIDIGHYYAISEQIDGPNWQQITLIPKARIKQIAYTPFVHELKWSLLSFAIMTIVMLWILWQYLAKPIRHFVNIIKQDVQPTFSRRLPESRKDELGDIARAYNALLDTIKHSYDELENKVAMRTIELTEAKQLAERATARKSEHLTTISHELRTPLNGITGSLELLQTTPLSEKQANLRNTAYTCAKSLLSIINNILDFSRIEADQVELNLRRYPILKIVDDAMVTIQPHLIDKPVKLHCIVNNDVPESSNLDSLRVQQILVNLLGNAAKFTEQGHIILTIKVEKNQLCFYIKDTGPGIKEEDQVCIFQPFVQSSHYKVGTGLGLSISEKIAIIMGGNITLKSNYGYGCTFIFRMPLLEPSSPMSLQPEPIVAPHKLHAQIALWGGQAKEGKNPLLENEELTYLPWRLWKQLYEIQHGISLPSSSMLFKTIIPWKLKILLVDDVATNRDIISQMLIELGQMVYTADSGRAALKLGKKHIFDLVLMDIRIPDIDGYQTTRLWRKSNVILDTECPIVALTANANPSEHEKTISLMNGYLTKPVSLEQLAQCIEMAAEIQIDRDMQPEVNCDNAEPIMKFSEDEFNHRLAQHFSDMIKRTQDCLQTCNWEDLRNILHNIKGSAALTGFDNIAKIAAELEKRLESQGQFSNDELEVLLIALEYNQSLIHHGP